MNYYKIKGILHSGTKGKRYTQREDDVYPQRKNRIVMFDKNQIFIGMPFVFQYVKDENGEDYSRYCLQVSSVMDIPMDKENMIIVETVNSFYVFEKIEKIDGVLVEELD